MTAAEIERVGRERDALRLMLEVTTGLLEEWCEAVKRDANWDGWDECFKAACYEPSAYNPHRGIIAKARALLAATATEGGNG